MKKFEFKNILLIYLKEGNLYSAYSPVFDMAAQGNTKVEARKNAKEAITIMIEEMIKDNTLDEVLTSLGWKKLEQQWSPPSYAGNNLITIPAREINA